MERLCQRVRTNSIGFESSEENARRHVLDSTNEREDPSIDDYRLKRSSLSFDGIHRVLKMQHQSATLTQLVYQLTLILDALNMSSWTISTLPACLSARALRSFAAATLRAVAYTVTSGNISS